MLWCARFVGTVPGFTIAVNDITETEMSVLNSTRRFRTQRKDVLRGRIVLKMMKIRNLMRGGGSCHNTTL